MRISGVLAWRSRRSTCALAAMVAAGFVAFTSGEPASAAVGECTADPASPTTTSTSTPASTTTTVLSQSRRPVLVTGAGPGGGPHVQVWTVGEGLLASFYAYGANFAGGVSVAAGDVNGDGHDDIITGAGPGGGPHVRVFDGSPNNAGTPKLTELAGFYAYAPHFAGGVSVATGDVDGDNIKDIVTGPGAGGGPHVRIFRGAAAPGNAPSLSILGEFMAYDINFHGGVSVAAADMGGDDDDAEIITGAGPGGGPHVRIVDRNGADMAGTGAGFMANSPNFHGGLNVAAACTDGVARIAAATASQLVGFDVFGPAGNRMTGAPYEAAATGLGIALGAFLHNTDPAVQAVSGFAEGDPQVLIWELGSPTEPVDGFDPYDVPIQITVAVGVL